MRSNFFFFLSIVVVTGCSGAVQEAKIEDAKTPAQPTTPPLTKFSEQEERSIAEHYYKARNSEFQRQLELLLKFRKDIDSPEMSKRLFSHKARAGAAKQHFDGDGKDTIPMETGTAGYTKGMRIVQIIDESTMLLSLGEQVVIGRGWNTSGFVDGDLLSPKDAVIVTGTADYDAVSGARKRVRVIQPFDLVKYEDDFPAKLPDAIREIVGDSVKVGEGFSPP